MISSSAAWPPCKYEEVMILTDRTMVKVSATENCLVFRTVSRKRKSPHNFYILRSELEQLEHKASVTARDIFSYILLRNDELRDVLHVQLFWLDLHADDTLSGRAETFILPSRPLMDFVSRSRPGEELKLLSMREQPKPLLYFHGSSNLHAALAHKTVRRKLIRFLRDNFNWNNVDEISFCNEAIPYSFGFQEYYHGQLLMNGGLILHGQEDMDTAYYL